jgi:hypothetical protein
MGSRCGRFFADRLATMAKQGVDRQVLSMWADIFGHGLPRAQAYGPMVRAMHDSIACCLR